MPRSSKKKRKNPAAVALGRLGGLKSRRIQKLSKEERLAFARKGGYARSKMLTAKQRSQSARKASLARWHGKKK